MPSGADFKTDSAGDGLARDKADDLLSATRDLAAITRRMSDILAPRSGNRESPNAGDMAAADMAAGFYRLRRLRDEVFDQKNLFGEPAWDLLLDLYVLADRGKTVSVTSACIAAAVPTTTGLRCIARLEKAGLIARQTDPNDGRRALISLTPKSATLLDGYLEECRRTFIRPAKTEPAGDVPD